MEPERTRDAGVIEMRVRKPEVGTVRGRIIDENGLPIALCTMSARMGKTTEPFTTDAEGRFVLERVPPNDPVSIAISVPGYGTWMRTALAGDTDCDFSVCPHGWGVVGEKAVELAVVRWFNHAPMTWEELRGRVVLLAFEGNSYGREQRLLQIRNLYEKYNREGLTVIVVYPYVLPERLTDLFVRSHTRQFSDVSLAGCFDADSDVIADLMPPARPVAAEGATHWLYQVHDRPAYFLIDKQGLARCNPSAAELEDWVQRLLAE
jgi:hypothetical protein